MAQLDRFGALASSTGPIVADDAEGSARNIVAVAREIVDGAPLQPPGSRV